MWNLKTITYCVILVIGLRLKFGSNTGLKQIKKLSQKDFHLIKSQENFSQNNKLYRYPLTS